MGLLIDDSQQQPSGLLGQGLYDPRSAALLNLAAGMIRGDTGGGMAAAGKAFQDAATANVQRADMAQQIGLRNIQLQQAMQQWQLTQPILARIAQRLGGQPASSSSAPSTAQGAAPGANPAADGGGMGGQPSIPSTPGGALGSGTFGIPTGGQTSVAPSQAASGPAGASDSIFGVPQDTAMLAFASKGLGGLADAALQFNKPTEAMLNANFAYGAGSPAALGAVRSIIDKQGTTSLRPGAPYIRNGQVFGTPPAAPQGYMNQPNGDGSWSVVPVPGGATAVAASNAAGAAGTGLGKLATTPQAVFNNGKAQPGVALNPFNITIPGVGMIGGGAAQGGASGAAGGAAASGNFLPTGPAQGSNIINEGNATSFVNTQQSVPKVLNSIAGDKNALDLVTKGSFATGKGSDTKYDWAALAQTWGLPVAKGATADYQLTSKYLANSLAQTAADMGMNGSDARFAAAQHGNPNIETQGPQALADSIRWVAGLKSGVPAYAQAAQKFMAANGNNPASLQDFQTRWNSAYDPNVFVTRWLQQNYGDAAAQDWIKEHKLNPQALGQNYQRLRALQAF